MHTHYCTCVMSHLKGTEYPLRFHFGLGGHALLLISVAFQRVLFAFSLGGLLMIRLRNEVLHVKWVQGMIQCKIRQAGPVAQCLPTLTNMMTDSRKGDLLPLSMAYPSFQMMVCNVCDLFSRFWGIVRGM